MAKKVSSIEKPAMAEHQQQLSGAYVGQLIADAHHLSLLAFVHQDNELFKLAKQFSRGLFKINELYQTIHSGDLTIHQIANNAGTSRMAMYLRAKAIEVTMKQIRELSLPELIKKSNLYPIQKKVQEALLRFSAE